MSAEEKRNMLEDLQDKKEDIDNQQQQLEQQQYHQVKLQQQISKGDFQTELLMASAFLTVTNFKMRLIFMFKTYT